MTEREIMLVKSAIAALSQPCTHPADVAFAKNRLSEALGQLTPVAADASESLANGIRCPECWAASGGHLPTCSRR